MNDPIDFQNIDPILVADYTNGANTKYTFSLTLKSFHDELSSLFVQFPNTPLMYTKIGASSVC
jgi:hypothetical protein